MKIGKQVVLGDGFSHINVDFDLIDIGNFATIKANFQAHTFENRLLKMGHVRIEDYSTLGTHAIPLYGTDIGTNTFVAPGSVIMKGETLNAWTSWEGNPARLNGEVKGLYDATKKKGSNIGTVEPLTKGKILSSRTSLKRSWSKLRRALLGYDVVLEEELS